MLWFMWESPGDALYQGSTEFPELVAYRGLFFTITVLDKNTSWTEVILTSADCQDAAQSAGW